MRVALLNLRYSPNLGDVLLCECLEFGLRRQAPELEVVQLDITGRRDFGKGSALRLTLLAVLQRLPQFLRQAIARVMLGRSLRRARDFWTSELALVDAAVLGGGHLLADADLNFPLKVAAIFRVAAKAGLRVGVHAVGASDNWSRSGEFLFRRAFRSVKLVYASVRDERSKAVWMRRLTPAGILEPIVVHDPGLLAADCYPAATRPPRNQKHVGLCISHPVALRYHADEDIPGPSAVTDWLKQLVSGLSEKGFSIYLFTTGSSEDEAYLESVTPVLMAAARSTGKVARHPAFASAGEMALFISGLDLVFAHRLHACVAAYAYGVAHIGFTWDMKMQSFFNSVGRSRYLVTAVSAPALELVLLGEEAMCSGVDAQQQNAVFAQTYAQLTTMLAALAPE